MKLEIKNINLSTVVFSAYPLIAFTLSVVNAFFAVAALGGDYSLGEKIMQGVLWALAETMVLLITTLVVAFMYNLLCSFGIRGVRFDIEEVESKNIEEGN